MTIQSYESFSLSLSLSLSLFGLSRPHLEMSPKHFTMAICKVQWQVLGTQKINLYSYDFACIIVSWTVGLAFIRDVMNFAPPWYNFRNWLDITRQSTTFLCFFFFFFFVWLPFCLFFFFAPPAPPSVDDNDEMITFYFSKSFSTSGRAWKQPIAAVSVWSWPHLFPEDAQGWEIMKRKHLLWRQPGSPVSPPEETVTRHTGDGYPLTQGGGGVEWRGGGGREKRGKHQHAREARSTRGWVAIEMRRQIGMSEGRLSIMDWKDDRLCRTNKTRDRIVKALFRL